MKGVVLYRLGKLEQAIPLLQRAHASIHQVNVDGNYVLGTCYILTQRYNDARIAFAAEYGFGADSRKRICWLAAFCCVMKLLMPRRPSSRRPW